MCSYVALLLPSNLEPKLTDQQKNVSVFLHRARSRSSNKNNTFLPVARLFGPALFEASKLKVVFLGVDEEKHPAKFPRAYTLTHSDITSKLTLAISQTINNSQIQGWYNRLQRDEVVAEWRKIKGKMSLHVHCHISGGHFLLDVCASLRYNIFRKELPVVLKAFVYGDGSLFKNHPELQESSVWVYFHSNIPEFNKVECWGPLWVASSPSGGTHLDEIPQSDIKFEHEAGKIPNQCQTGDCTCCFPSTSLIAWPQHKNLSTDTSSHASSSSPEDLD